MEYTKHYNLLIERARVRTLPPDQYVEVHHVIPRCMGGSDDPSNLVSLTPEEHVVAHLLLMKMYPDVIGLIWAVRVIYGSNVKNGTIVKNNKEYGWVKRRMSEEYSRRMTGNTQNRGLVRSEETKKKISEANTGRKLSDETRKKMSESRKGRKLSEEAKQKLSAAKKGKPRKKGYVFTEEHRQKLSAANKGKQLSEEHKKKLSDARKEAIALRKENNTPTAGKGKPWSEARRLAYEQNKKEK